MAKEGLQFEFSASTAEYRKAVESMPRDLQKAADKIEDIGQEINTSMSKAVGRGLVQGLAAGGVVLKLRQVIDHFDQLSDAAKRFGTSAEDIQRIDVAAKQSGVSIESVATAMEEAGTKANKAAREGGKFLESFNRSGIDAAAFASAGLAEKIEMVGAAQAAAAGDTQRLTEITEALGNTVGRVDFATMASSMQEVSVLSDGMVDALSRANGQIQSFDRGLNLVAGFTLGLLGEAFQRATSAAIALGTQDFSIFGKNIEELKAMSEGLPPLFDKTTTSVENTTESTVNYSEVLQKLISVNAEMEAGMDRMEKSAGSLGAQLAEAELRLAELSQQFAQSGEAELFKEIEKTAKEILTLRQRTAKEEEKIRNETAKTSEEYRKQADAQARSIVSLDEEIEMLEAKLSGNKELTDYLQRQQDFRRAFEETRDSGRADRLADLLSRERQMAEGGQGGSAGGFSFGSFADRAPTDNERIAALRGDFRAREAEQRAAALQDRNMFRSAVAAENRAQRRRDRAMESARLRDTFEETYGASNFGEAFREYQRETPFGQRLTEDQFKKFHEDMAKTPEQRAREEAMRQKQGGAGDQKKDPAITMDDIFKLLKKHVPAIDEKLPQTALV